MRNALDSKCCFADSLVARANVYVYEEGSYDDGNASWRRIPMFNTKKINESGEVVVAICPLCNLRVEFIGAPMVRCYYTGDMYEPERIVWVLESEIPKETGYDVENLRGNNKLQDFLPNAHATEDETER